MNTFSTRPRRGAAIFFSGVLVLGGLALTGGAAAVEEVDGNPTCSSLGYEYEYKSSENPTAGYYPIVGDGMDANLQVGTYTGPDQPDPNTNNAIVGYSISTSADGYAVIVKGGDGANVYRELTNPMHAPAVPNGKWPTISHFQLCWNGPPELGQLEVTKVVTGEGAPIIEYEICIEGLDPVTTKQCQKVAASGVATFEKLVPGTYKVTETPLGSAYTVSITPTDTPQVTAGDIPTKITVTNAYKAPPPPPPEEAVVPPTVEALPPTAPVTPTVPVTPTTPAAPVTPAAPTEVASQAALPTTGNEGGLAAIAVVLVAAGIGLTLLSKRHGPQQA